jgi:hypothetical protein
MPTIPPKRLFDPGSAESQAQPSLDASVNLLTEVRNYGLSVLLDCAERSNRQDHDVPILMLYRHLLEVLDGFSILVAAMAPLPAEFQLRSLLEALFSIKYITKEDSARRALCYLVVTYHVEARKVLATLDPTTPQNKNFVSKFSQDEILSGVQLPELQNADQDRQALDRILNAAPLKDIYDEYLRVKRQRNRNPNWYELFQGPRNMEQLAQAINMPGLYQQIYRNTSESLHCGRTIREGLVRTSTGALVYLRCAISLDCRMLP